MSSQQVKIAARLRPRLPMEVDDGSVLVEHAHGSASGGTGSCIVVTNPRVPSQVFKFPFTSCYDHDSTQDEIFSNDVAPMLDYIFEGITVTIFAYGVTSSGKTHTMQGTKSDPGVIPRVVRAVFDKRAAIEDQNVTIDVSYMEIYKDEVYDLLLARDKAPKLPVRENDCGQVFVANLSSTTISSMAEFDALYAQATKQRSVSSTLLNHASSRSHAVLTLTVSLLSQSSSSILTGKINLVDLAGSENNKLTGNDPSRMAESAAINKSLSVLGQVVHALNQGASRIPYRNSKLTRILQDALGGSSVGLLICNLAPGVKFRQDTLNTLNFAVRTKNVENKPVINERDTRAAPKPHFSAPQVSKALRPASIPSSTNMSGPQPPRPSLAIAASVGRSPLASRRRSSIVGRPSSILARPRLSKVPRLSILPRPIAPSQPFRLPRIDDEGPASASGSGILMTEEEIDARISRAVEIEVARRLKEEEEKRLRLQQQQEEHLREREQEQEQHSSVLHDRRSLSPQRDVSEPSIARGILTPLLRRHRDLDDELKGRLAKLEKKLERGDTDKQLADVLSPVSKKRTGRAYVALARAHSEKGDLQVALDLYRRAASYVPDNQKLRERIIEIEESVRNDRPFVASPKKAKAKRNRGKGKKNSTRVEEPKDAEDGDDGEADAGSDADADAVEAALTVNEGNQRRQRSAGLFGQEITNDGASDPPARKRPSSDFEEPLAAPESPVKRQKKGKGKAQLLAQASDEEPVSAVAPKHRRRRSRKHVEVQ